MYGIRRKTKGSLDAGSQVFALNLLVFFHRTEVMGFVKSALRTEEPSVVILRIHFAVVDRARRIFPAMLLLNFLCRIPVSHFPPPRVRWVPREE